jgi:sarcosine/dimethylglycine N-methyltransferase
MSSANSILELYRSHPLTADAVLTRLEREGKDLSAVTVFDLSTGAYPDICDMDHIGGIEYVEVLASLSNITAQSRVLDVCCGLGGAARYLATVYECQVIGLDITSVRVKDAVRLTELVDLQALAQFVLADAIRIPLVDSYFDVVIGQSAWSHIEDKLVLLKECYRVLVPGGSVAFEDSLEGTQPCPEEYKRAAKQRNAELLLVGITANEYIRLLRAAGFIDIYFTDLFDDWIRWLERIYSSPVGQWPPEEENAINELEMARAGATSYGRFVARKP